MVFFDDEDRKVANVAALDRTDVADGTPVTTLGYYTPGDGGGRLYLYDEASTATVDNALVENGPDGVGRFIAVSSDVERSQKVLGTTLEEAKRAIIYAGVGGHVHWPDGTYIYTIGGTDDSTYDALEPLSNQTWTFDDNAIIEWVKDPQGAGANYWPLIFMDDKHGVTIKGLNVQVVGTFGDLDGSGARWDFPNEWTADSAIYMRDSYSNTILDMSIVGKNGTTDEYNCAVSVNNSWGNVIRGLRANHGGSVILAQQSNSYNNLYEDIVADYRSQSPLITYGPGHVVYDNSTGELGSTTRGVLDGPNIMDNRVGETDVSAQTIVAGLAGSTIKLESGSTRKTGAVCENITCQNANGPINFGGSHRGAVVQGLQWDGVGAGNVNDLLGGAFNFADGGASGDPANCTFTGTAESDTDAPTSVSMFNLRGVGNKAQFLITERATGDYPILSMNASNTQYNKVDLTVEDSLNLTIDITNVPFEFFRYGGQDFYVTSDSAPPNLVVSAGNFFQFERDNNDRIAIPITANTSTGLTVISEFARISSITSYVVGVADTSVDTNYVGLQQNSSGVKAQYRQGSTVSTTDNLTGVGVIRRDALVIDGTDLILYTNGSSVDTATISGSFTADTLTVGGLTRNSGFVNGAQVRHVATAVFDSALTPTQLSDLETARATNLAAYLTAIDALSPVKVVVTTPGVSRPVWNDIRVNQGGTRRRFTGGGGAYSLTDTEAWEDES